MVDDSRTRSLDPGADKTRTWLLSGSVVFLAVLLAVGMGLFSLHRAARARLDEAMGERLTAVARTAAHLVDGDSLRVWSYDRGLETLDFILLHDALTRIRRENGLSEVTLSDADGFVVISTLDRVPRGEWNPYLELDSGAVAAARSGIASAGELERAGTIDQKSAHAPVVDLDGEVAGLVSVEAEADYFDALSTLNRGAWITAGVVLAVLLALATVLGRLVRDVVRARAVLAEQDKLAAMGRMTAGIAHEIRNPLGVIRIAGESLGSRLRDAGEDVGMAEYVVDEVDRLDRILTRYLTFGRGGGLDVTFGDLEKTVRRTVRDVGGEMGRAAVAVAVEGEARPVPFDAPSLQQVLLNLLFNARDAAVESDEPAVAVALMYEAARVRIDVADTGPGLGGRDPESFFAPFMTTKEKGSGLGLAVVRQVIEDHGGAVRLRERADGPGAVAEVELPAPRPDEE